MSAPLISMTVSQIPPGFTIRPGNPIFVQFCEDDEPLYQTGRWVGMADQAIFKAQKQTRSPIVLDAVIMREDKCVTVEAMSAQIFKNGHAAPSAKSKRSVAADELEVPWEKDLITGETVTVETN